MAEKKIVRGIHIGPTKTGKMRWSLMTLGAENQKQWFSTFSPEVGRPLESLKENDVVELNFYQKGDFMNIISLKKLEDAPTPAPVEGPPESGDEYLFTKHETLFNDKQALIVAQSCLTRAVELLKYVMPDGTIPQQGYEVPDVLAKVEVIAHSLQEYVWQQVGKEEKEGLAETDIAAK